LGRETEERSQENIISSIKYRKLQLERDLGEKEREKREKREERQRERERERERKEERVQ
jgi:hypothetical protein